MNFGEVIRKYMSLNALDKPTVGLNRKQRRAEQKRLRKELAPFRRILANVRLPQEPPCESTQPPALADEIVKKTLSTLNSPTLEPSE